MIKFVNGAKKGILLNEHTYEFSKINEAYILIYSFSGNNWIFS